MPKWKKGRNRECGCMGGEQNGREWSAEQVIKSLNEKELELYLYSLHKLAENNLESNRQMMTELYNLRGFNYKAAEEMLQNPELKFAMIILDFANFKSINEFCGRSAGDDLLKCVADALRVQKKKRAHVVLSHVRADVFAILTPYEKKSDLVDMVKEIDEQIASFQIVYKVLPAFGICVAESYTTPVSLMKDCATMALNTIKGKFYAKYAFFDDKMRDQMMLNKMIENDIIGALEENQLAVFVQPKVDMRNGRIIGGEALVRWLHPERGTVSPAQFLPVLEQNGLIIDVDVYVWTKVFEMIGRRLEEGKHVVPVSINISRSHVFDRDFRKRLVGLATQYHVPPEYVFLELTESGFSEQEDVMYENMKFLKEYGFTLSMDDFGTGYSTMTMLKNQPVDEIKIDRGFILDIRNSRSQTIMRHTIQMLHELDVSIIVEGVEEKEQQDFLLDCGCRRAQGFLYYQPMPAAEFECLLDQKENKISF